MVSTDDIMKVLDTVMDPELGMSITALELIDNLDIDNGKVIFEEELNRGVKNFVPDSFFIKDDLLFLLKEKTELLVCSIKK